MSRRTLRAIPGVAARVRPERAWRYRMEAAALRVTLALLRAVGLDAASAVGGFLGRAIGPRTGRSRKAERELRRTFPEKGEAEIAAILREMWDNLGRTAAEYAHLDKFHCYRPGGRIEVVGVEHIDRARATGKGAVCVAGHFANWELLPLAASEREAFVGEVYRAPNNPLVDEWITERRRELIAPVQIPKGRKGMREMVAHLRRGGHIAMLVDQKLDDGISVPFLGRAAMTTAAPAQLALKFGCPIVPACIERLGGARFRITVFPPIEMEATGDADADVAAITARINAMIGDWVRARPGQWLWVHNRWPA